VSDEEPVSYVHTPEFTGRGDEYFRIWIVNVLLTLVTFGVYSAWAKVRRAKYFRNNTRLAGHVFDYHGSPKAILRGRLVALVLLTAYSWAFQFSNAAGLVTVIGLCAAGPWLFMRAQQFAFANTSFRGLRFGFQARASDAYLAVLPLLALWVLPEVAFSLTSGDGWLTWSPMLVFLLAWPLMHHQRANSLPVRPLYEFFVKMRELESRLGMEDLPDFLSSHPSTDERLRRLRLEWD
jgi:hypothetical protein